MNTLIEGLLQETEAAFSAVLTLHNSGKTRRSEVYKDAITQVLQAKHALSVYKKTMRSAMHWTAQDGKVIKIKDLEDSHLANILRMLKRNAQSMLAPEIWDFDDDLVQWTDAFFDYELKRVKNLIREAKKRNLTWDYEN